MQLYNTAERRKQEFIPVTPGKVGMYVCGITAYDYCHIGHARSAVVFDVLARYLRHKGLDVTFVRNFTDVDDKIINRANQEGLPSHEISEKYIAAFHEDMGRLGIERASVEPKATENIPEMIAMCETLIAKNMAYATPSGDVYYRVRSFKDYGKLSGRDLDEMQAGARIAPGEEKQDPLDFALWKGAKPGEPAWESPWGQGRPGWHIECSAMSKKYLPLPLDIHGGGQDLVFPHHENEIAQTEGCCDTEFARYWVHNGFVQVDSEKMSKSLGNFKTLRDILESYLPETLRWFLLARQYRSPIDFTGEAINDAEKNQKRIYEAVLAAQIELMTPSKRSGNKLPEEIRKEFESQVAAFSTSMDDDLNTAAALGHIFSIIRLISRVLEDKTLRKSADTPELLQAFERERQIWHNVLGLCGQDPAVFLTDLKNVRLKRRNLSSADIDRLVAERQEARAAKDFAKSDALRDELHDMGVEIRDTPQGVVWDLL